MKLKCNLKKTGSIFESVEISTEKIVHTTQLEH